MMRKFIVNVNGTSYEVEVEEIDGSAAKVAPATSTAPAAAPASAAPAAGEKTIVSPMPGNILGVNVSAGQTVKSGAVLVILEAMKMENEILAPADGIIREVRVAKGAAVNAGDVLVVMG